MGDTLFRDQARSAAPGSENPYSVLVVDDDRTTRMVLEQQVADLGYEVRVAENGADAFEQIRRNPDAVDTILADKVMPVMDGIALVKRLKASAETRRIPVIMLTGDNSPEDIKAGVDAGVFYYLAKPVSPPILASVLSAALREVAQKRALAAELHKHRSGFERIDICRFRFKSLDEAQSVASLLASCFDAPEKALVGLYELLVNAVEHGNLEIGYEGKSALLRAGTWRQEIEARLKHPQFSGRAVEATALRKPDGVYAIVKDQGEGFAWRDYLRVDAARATNLNGRGIAKANHLCFDKLSFSEKGNQVVCFMSNESELDW
jgi:CheY-like chemotaxis protein/anti-sigma regulatory factor (Ser/Thr protein kinase)